MSTELWGSGGALRRGQISDGARQFQHAVVRAVRKAHLAHGRNEQRPTDPRLLAAAEGWGEAMRDGDIAVQREVLAALIKRVLPIRIGRARHDLQIARTLLGEGLRAAVLTSAAAVKRSAA